MGLRARVRLGAASGRRAARYQAVSVSEAAPPETAAGLAIPVLGALARVEREAPQSAANDRTARVARRRAGSPAADPGMQWSAASERAARVAPVTDVARPADAGTRLRVAEAPISPAETVSGRPLAFAVKPRGHRSARIGPAREGARLGGRPGIGHPGDRAAAQVKGAPERQARRPGPRRHPRIPQRCGSTMDLLSLLRSVDPKPEKVPGDPVHLPDATSRGSVRSRWRLQGWFSWSGGRGPRCWKRDCRLPRPRSPRSATWRRAGS